MADSKPSKSERKREQRDLQALGEQLALLPDDVRRGLPLGERLQDALDDLRRMQSREAIRRQKQFIGRLMRGVDAAPIREFIAARRASERDEKRLFARAERWRDRLALERHDALAAFESEIGRRSAGVARLLEELATARDERSERRLRRELFREIHATLVARGADR